MLACPIQFIFSVNLVMKSIQEEMLFDAAICSFIYSRNHIGIFEGRRGRVVRAAQLWCRKSP